LLFDSSVEYRKSCKVTITTTTIMADQIPTEPLVVAVSHNWFNLGRVVEGLTYILPTLRLGVITNKGNWTKIIKFLDLIDAKFAKVRDMIKECDFTEASYPPLDAEMEVLMPWVDLVRNIICDPKMTKKQAEAKVKELGVLRV
jgi:hypothetical protein